MNDLLIVGYIFMDSYNKSNKLETRIFSCAIDALRVEKGSNC